MQIDEKSARWERLMLLLAPVLGEATSTARRLSPSFDEGDDLLQEAVLRAFEKLPGLREPARFRGWFYAVLLSVHRSRSRRHFWRRFLSLDEQAQSGLEPAGEDGARWEDERAGAERASRALATLSAPEREAVVLFEIEGFSVQEVAAMQNVSISAVKSRLARGRTRLRRHYEKRYSSSGMARFGNSPAEARPRVAACSGRGPAPEGGTQ